jgi:hypothetical protein
VQFVNFLKNCFFFGAPASGVTSTTSFILKNIVFYIVLGTIVKSNISDPVEASIEMLMRVLVTIVFVSSLLYLAKEMSQFAAVFAAILFCENFFMLFTAIKELLTLFTLLPQWNIYAGYFGWFLIVWHVLVLMFILKRTLILGLLMALIYAASYYVMMSSGTAFFMEALF